MDCFTKITTIVGILINAGLLYCSIRLLDNINIAKDSYVESCSSNNKNLSLIKIEKSIELAKY